MKESTRYVIIVQLCDSLPDWPQHTIKVNFLNGTAEPFITLPLTSHGTYPHYYETYYIAYPIAALRVRKGF